MATPEKGEKQAPQRPDSIMDADVESNGRLEAKPTNDTVSPIINFKTLTWWQGGIVLVAETVSLGILSLPKVIASVGLVPGIILILIMSGLSTWSGLMLGEFRKEYPHVENFGDAVEVIGKSIGMGPLFQEIFGWAQVLFQVFVMGAHLLTWTICLDALRGGGVCKIIWAVIGLVVFALLNLPRTLKLTSWTSITSCLSITIATLLTVGYVGTHKAPDVVVEITKVVPFTTAFLGVTNIAVAFSSHSCFFGVIGEFKNPEDWPKALALLQIIDTSLYLIAAIVIYVYVGKDVPAPALLAATDFKWHIAIWAIAIPTIVIAGVIYGHVAAKYVFGRIFRNSKHLVHRTMRSTIVWVAMIFAMWAVALVIAESIPIFDSLLGLLAALFVSWFSYGLPGIFWLWMHHGNWTSSPGRAAKFAANILLVITGVMVCALGLWASVESIIESEAGKPWAC